jgi:hypothetical protein
MSPVLLDSMSTTALPSNNLQKRTPATLRLFRKTHLYFGLFISPALLFFSFTGAVQTLSLHEAAGSSYKPPAILAELGQLHKKQTTVMPVRKPQEGGASRDGEHAHDDGPKHGAGQLGATQPGAAQQQTVTLAGKQKQHLPVKIFFLAVAIGLLTSTSTGVYMAYKYERSRVAVTATLIAGVVVPLLLLKF